MDKKYQIFISSTYKDLIPEREKVRDVILSMYHFPIGMEMFNAADEEQWEIIQETIDSSDYYVLILGKRYGTLITKGTDAGISYTEKEYRYAMNKRIPVLTFIKKDKAITADKIDSDPDKLQKLNALVKEITSTREADWFENVDELGTKISLALHKQMDRKKRPGWVRGDRFDVDASLNEMVTLSQRIRELEEENRRLRMSAVERKPKLSISIQYNGTIDDPIEVNDGEDSQDDEVYDYVLPTTETVERRFVLQEGYLVRAEKLQPSDVPEELQALVTQNIIDEYNKKLPDEAAIREYNQQMRFYNEVHKNGQRLNFIISNEGTAKATDINITMDFPKSVLVMKRSEAEKFAEPTKPDMPSDPIEEAMTQKYITSRTGKVLTSMLHLMSAPYDGLNLGRGDSPLNIDFGLPQPRFASNWSVNIEGQTVNIWSRDLLHTYSKMANELCIIPMEKGTFKIIVSLMCEEYIQPEKMELELVVK